MRLRLDDCAPALLLGSAQPTFTLVEEIDGRRHVAVDDHFMAALAAQSSDYDPSTSANDMAMYQYTSGTTRQLPDAIKHRHRAIVTVMLAALYGTGVRPRDHLCCPVVTGVGTWPMARNAGAACDGCAHQQLSRKIRSATPVRGPGETRDQQFIGSGYTLPHAAPMPAGYGIRA